MHNKTTWNENLLAGKLDNWYHWYLSKHGVGPYAINSLLCLEMMRKIMLKYGKDLSVSCKCMPRQKEFFLRVIYPFFLPPSKLQEIVREVKRAIQITNPD